MAMELDIALSTSKPAGKGLQPVEQEAEREQEPSQVDLVPSRRVSEFNWSRYGEEWEEIEMELE